MVSLMRQSARSVRFHACQAIKWIAPCSRLTFQRKPSPVWGEATPPYAVPSAVPWIPACSWLVVGTWEIGFSINPTSPKQDQWITRKAMRQWDNITAAICKFVNSSGVPARAGVTSRTCGEGEVIFTPPLFSSEPLVVVRPERRRSKALTETIRKHVLDFEIKIIWGVKVRSKVKTQVFRRRGM